MAGGYMGYQKLAIIRADQGGISFTPAASTKELMRDAINMHLATVEIPDQLERINELITYLSIRKAELLSEEQKHVKYNWLRSQGSSHKEAFIAAWGQEAWGPEDKECLTESEG